MEVGKLNNIPANNRWVSKVTAMEVKGKDHDEQQMNKRKNYMEEAQFLVYMLHKVSFDENVYDKLKQVVP